MSLSGDNPAGQLVFGAGVDEVVAEYAGAGTGSRLWYHADERGSTIALSDTNGNG